MRPYLPQMLGALLACFLLQALALGWSGGRTLKSESNYFSSLGRIQAAARGNPEILMTGSSLTGRLPDRAQGFEGLANMGCDGGCAIDALRAIDRGILPLGDIVVIEANTLRRAFDPNPSEVGVAMQGLWFQIGLHFPLLSAYARPAAFFYSPLLERRIGALSAGSHDDDLNLGNGPVWVEPPSRTWGEAEDRLVNEMVPLVRRLKDRGAMVVFVWLPPARSDGVPPPDWVLAMAARTGAGWWDIANQANPELIELTDGRHMSGKSAALTSNTLIQGLTEHRRISETSRHKTKHIR